MCKLGRKRSTQQYMVNRALRWVLSERRKAGKPRIKWIENIKKPMSKRNWKTKDGRINEHGRTDKLCLMQSSPKSRMKK